MKLIQFVLQQRSFTWAAFLIFMILGVASIPALSKREDPDLEGRFFQIIVRMPGADTAVVEQLVAQPIERALLELDNTKIVETTSRPGAVVVRVEPVDRTPDLGIYTRKLRARMDDLRTELPEQVTSVEINDRFSDTVAMIVSVRRPGATPRELEDYARKVRSRLREFDEVAEATLVGDVTPEIAVRLNSARIAQYSITPDQIRRALVANNVLPESGGGVTAGQKRIDIQSTGQLDSLAAIRQTPLIQTGGTNVVLGDVADVSETVQDPPPSMVRVNGERAVAIALTMRKGLDLTRFGDEVRARLANVSKELPNDVHIDVVNDLPTSVKERIAEFTENLVVGVVLIAVVTFLFMGIRSAIVVTLSLPITVIGVFLAMRLLGRDIQQISVAALIISLGLVVDNAIVVVDNIERRLAQGLGQLDAVEKGTLELVRPLVFSNLTAIGAFGPLAFLSGGKGDFIRDLGLITGVSIVVSLVLNLSAVPLLAGVLLRVESGHRLGFVQRITNRLFGGLNSVIARIATASIPRAGLTVTIAAILFFLSVKQIPNLGQQFFPTALRSQFAIDVILPEGASIFSTEQTVKQVEGILAEEKRIASVAAYVGQGSPRFYYNFTPEPPSNSIAQLVVNTVDAKSASEMIPQLQARINARVPGATIIVKQLTQGPPSVAPIVLRLTGDRVDDLRAAADQVRAEIRKTPGAGLFYDDFRERRIATRLRVDENRANDAGVSPGQILQLANLGFAGQTVTEYRDGEREIPVVLRLAMSETTAEPRIEDVYVTSSNGSPVRVGDVAESRLVGEDSRLVRRNGHRTLSLFGYSDGTRSNLAVFEDVWSRVKDMPLPGGVKVAYDGDKHDRELSFLEIGMVSAVGVLLNVLAVSALFADWRMVVAIMCATPFSLVGGIAGLVIAHQPFGFMAVIGIVALGGVVTNHTIFLFEYAEERRRQGMTVVESLIWAGKDRFRPILLTVLLSIMGLIPQAVNGGSLWPPLAYALIFGLLISLLITLVTIPSLYALISRRADKKKSVTTPAE